MVDLVAVRDAYPAEILQKFPGMAGIARPLVFIQDNLTVCIHPAGAVYPHIALTSGRSSVLVYQHGRFIRLQHMVAVHLFMQVIIEDRKVAVRTLDRPVRHVLSGNMQAVTFKLLFLPVERHRIDIFGIHHGRFQRRGHKASP